MFNVYFILIKNSILYFQGQQRTSHINCWRNDSAVLVVHLSSAAIPLLQYESTSSLASKALQVLPNEAKMYWPLAYITAACIGPGICSSSCRGQHFTLALGLLSYMFPQDKTIVQMSMKHNFYRWGGGAIEGPRSNAFISPCSTVRTLYDKGPLTEINSTLISSPQGRFSPDIPRHYLEHSPGLLGLHYTTCTMLS